MSQTVKNYMLISIFLILLGSLLYFKFTFNYTEFALNLSKAEETLIRQQKELEIKEKAAYWVYRDDIASENFTGSGDTKLFDTDHLTRQQVLEYFFASINLSDTEQLLSLFTSDVISKSMYQVDNKDKIENFTLFMEKVKRNGFHKIVIKAPKSGMKSGFIKNNTFKVTIYYKDSKKTSLDIKIERPKERFHTPDSNMYFINTSLNDITDQIEKNLIDYKEK